MLYSYPTILRKKMNEYELMLLRDRTALEETIKGLIYKVIKSQDEEAKAELSTIKKTIRFDVDIKCEAYFEPHANTLNATALFSSIKEFEDADEYCDGYSHDFENQYYITWDDDCGYGDFSLEKSSANVSVDIDGLTTNASKELVTAYEKRCDELCEQRKKERAAERIEELLKELEVAQQLLKD